jgi:hypothetical protein
MTVESVEQGLKLRRIWNKEERFNAMSFDK